MDSRVQRQRPYLAQEGSNMGHTQPNMNQNWSYSSPKQGLEEAMQQMSLRPRDTRAGLETSVGLYPERPGESDCAYYSRTGLCGFGMNCRFNHPPNLKQAPQVEEKRPERLEQLECQYYKTGSCKFGATCKYSHSDGKTGSAGQVEFNFLGLPMRQGERECTYYMRNGSCKYGVTCKYHHPEPAAVGMAVTVAGCAMHVTAGFPSAAPSSSAAPYSPGLPSWQLEGAPYVSGAHLQGPSAYMHAMYPPPQGMPSMPGWNPDYQGPVSKSTFSEEKQQPFGMGLLNVAMQPNSVAVSDGHAGLSPSGPVCTPAIGHPAVQSQVAFSQGEAFPERPGQPECQHFLKMGDCKFGAACRFHHPKARVEESSPCVLSQMGLPSQPGAVSKSTFSEEKHQPFGMGLLNAATQPNSVAVSDGRAGLSPSGPVCTPAIGHPAVQSQVAFLQGEAFPERPGQPECQHFLKTGDCKFGAACRFHHPKVRVEESSPCVLSQMGLPSQPGPVSRSTFLEEKQCPVGMGLLNAATQPNNAAVSGGQAVLTPSGPVSSAAIGHLAVQSQVAVSQKETFPERPGQPECQHFLKTGDCKFGAACRFHHPKERVEQSTPCMLSQMGLPIRPGQPTCVFYSRYGICKFGPMCKYDHPLTGLHNNPSVPMHCELNGAPYPRGGSTTSKHVQPTASETSERFSKIKDQF